MWRASRRDVGHGVAGEAGRQGVARDGTVRPRRPRPWTEVEVQIHTLTESSGYMTQCSRIPAMAPAVIVTATLLVGSFSYSSGFMVELVVACPPAGAHRCSSSRCRIGGRTHLLCALLDYVGHDRRSNSTIARHLAEGAWHGAGCADCCLFLHTKMKRGRGIHSQESKKLEFRD